ncbi:hypothetical protein [Agrobacterium rosae]
MTISSEVSKAGPYFGNGSTTVFPYGFKILDEKHIEVVVMDASFVVSTLSLAGGDYTVTGVGSETGGTIVKSSPLLTGQKLNMVRRPDFTQETSLENQGPYYPEVIEGRFDVTVMQIQALKEGLDRAISVPVGEERPEIKDVFDALRESGENADSAAASALLSQRYANEPEDSAISPGLFSAFHWFRKALAQATGAAASAALALTRSNNAQTSATNSANSATASETSRQASGTSATNSANSATASESSRQASGTSATNSANSATASQASRVASETARTGSEAARDTAQTHATNAGNSATSASGSAGTATTKAAESVTARNFSYKWASEVENTQVNDGVRSGYSAYHWAKKAEASVGGQAFVQKSGDTMTGGLTATEYSINKTEVQDVVFYWKQQNINRFAAFVTADGATFNIAKYTGPGAYNGAVISINRGTGFVDITTALAVANELYVRAAVEIGKMDGTAGPALIDFHTSATVRDYNCRIICDSNASDALGMGTMNIIASNVMWNGNSFISMFNKGTAADIAAGTADKFPDAPAVKAAITANVQPALGIGQTWKSVSRGPGTAYQNTTGKPIVVAVNAQRSQAIYFQISADGTTWVNVPSFTGVSGSNVVLGGQFVIPNNHYYRINDSGAVGVSFAELS